LLLLLFIFPKNNSHLREFFQLYDCKTKNYYFLDSKGTIENDVYEKKEIGQRKNEERQVRRGIVLILLKIYITGNEVRK
jgi:hypothetical protein